MAIFYQYLAISQKWCKIETWLLWNTKRNLYVLYQLVLFPVTLSDPNYAKPPHFDILHCNIVILISKSVSVVSFFQIINLSDQSLDPPDRFSRNYHHMVGI